MREAMGIPLPRSMIQLDIKSSGTLHDVVAVIAEDSEDGLSQDGFAKQNTYHNNPILALNYRTTPR